MLPKLTPSHLCVVSIVVCFFVAENVAQRHFGRQSAPKWREDCRTVITTSKPDMVESRKPLKLTNALSAHCNANRADKALSHSITLSKTILVGVGVDLKDIWAKVLLPLKLSFGTSWTESTTTTVTNTCSAKPGFTAFLLIWPLYGRVKGSGYIKCTQLFWSYKKPGSDFLFVVKVPLIFKNTGAIKGREECAIKFFKKC